MARMDELKGVAKRGLERLSLARDRERMRVTDRIARMDEMDECAREYLRMIRYIEYTAERKEAEKPRLRLLGLAEIIGDDQLREFVGQFLEGEKPTDERYIALARRLAELRARTFADPK